MKDIRESIKKRRSIYALSNEHIVDVKEIEEVVNELTKYVPSAFNMQSQRIVLLVDDEHRKLWDIVLATLKEKVSDEEAFKATKDKVENAFKAGYATILYYEDQDTVHALEEKVPLYKDNFSVWSNQQSAMLQFSIWTTLDSMGLGANLQHYNPIIDDEVQKTWDIPKSWKLIAQMPIGKPLNTPDEKDFMPIDQRVKIFK